MQKPDMTPLVRRRVFDLPLPEPIYLIPNEPETQYPVDLSNIPLEARMPILWTVKDIVQQLQLKPSTIYAWAAQGRIPCIKIHGLVRFCRDDIERWVESFRVHESPVTLNAVPRGPRAALDELIARAKGQAYNSRPRGNQTQSSPIGKEETDGAV